MAARRIGTWVVAALLAMVWARDAAAADWYVDASAGGGGTGSQFAPFSTINAALASLQRGDTVWIASGTYPEVVNVTGLSGSGTTTFRAMPGATPIIDGTNGSSAAMYVLQTAVADTTFEGLTVQNALNGALAIQFYYADGGSVIDCTTNGITGNAVNFYYSSQGTVTGCKLQGNIGGRKTTGTVVENNEVYGSSAEGIGLYDGSSNCTVAHNVIHDNFSVNLYLDSISHSVFDGNFIYESTPGNDLEGIEISDEGHYSDLAAPVNSYNTIINNVIVGHQIGIAFWYSDEWSTQQLNDESGLRYDVISNNTVVDNQGALKWDASPAHVGTTIQNNIFVSAAGTNPSYLLQANSAGGISLDHNLWYAPDLSQPYLWVGNQTDHAGFVTASGQGASDVLADPKFAGPSSAPPVTNLELASGSPAIGAGVTLPAVTTDFLGGVRPSTGTDIGAFQYGAVVLPADGGVGPDGGDAAAGPGGEGGAPPPDGGDAGLSSDGATGGANGPGGAHSSGCACRVTTAPAGGGGKLVAAALLVAIALLRRLRRGVRGIAIGACLWLGVMAPAGCSSSSRGEPVSGCADDVCSPGEGGSDSGSGSSSGSDAARDSSHDAPDASNPASCSFDGQTVASGASVTAYQASSVPAGSVCVSQQRVCTDGVLSGTFANAACSVTLVPAFYVAPGGNDMNPGTLAQPFLTLAKAQSAMQASASIKTTYLRAGSYALSASSGTSNCDYGMGTTAINLDAADSGETWSYYPPDGFGTAILDGGSTSPTTGVACAFAASNAPKLTFIGLQFQHLQYSAIWVSSSPNLVASDNTIHDLTVGIFNIGAIVSHSSSDVTVTNNYIHDVAYVGVGAWGGSMSNTTISGNVILSSCTAAAQPGGNDQDGGDCGAIYLWDTTHASTNGVVSNNYIRDVNVSSNGAGDYTGCCATGIYLDDGMSNVTVSGNVVTGIKSQCFAIHGGNNDTYRDNLCDLSVSQYQRVMIYQWDSLMLPMSGNSIENNVIVAGSMSAGTGYSDGGTPTPPTIENNAYYNYVGTTVDSSGTNGSDTNPTYEDPGISCWDPTIPATSPVYAAPVSFTKLVGGWGPPGFVLPQTGTPPSWPHGC